MLAIIEVRVSERFGVKNAAKSAVSAKCSTPNGVSERFGPMLETQAGLGPDQPKSQTYTLWIF